MNNQLEIYKTNNSWPFVEARRILKKINNKTPEKGFVLFETGYGPSGLPHIGTFSEVVRTSFVRYAFECLAPNIPTKLFCVSDDIDALRKIPDNIPNKNLILQKIGLPLTKVPDPFNTHESYGHHMNSKLRSFLDKFKFQYEFVSATEKYTSGDYDEIMKNVMRNYDKIMDLMLPNLGQERQKTYSPFMPIDCDSGQVIEKGVKAVDKENYMVFYTNSLGKEKTASILKGGCKLQWKVDFGARWANLEVDYEIYGKDHLPNEKIYRKICNILGKESPVNLTYEMFLGEDGSKISKSKGNGISVDDWLKYAPEESISLYMFQKPKTAKRLYFDVIPRAMDDYLSFASSYHNLTLEQQVSNPLFFIHSNQVPKINFNLNYSLLLNLASACNPESDDILWGFIQKYQPGLNKENSPLLRKMVQCAINYYNDFIKNTKEYRKPNQNEAHALIDLKNQLSTIDKKSDTKTIQNIIFFIGRSHGYEQNMKDWFSALYQILLGQKQGPRIGSFISLFGINNFIKMIDRVVY